jgi:hypothetical protein
MNMKIEKLISELRRGIWTLKNGMIYCEEQYEEWKVYCLIENSNMDIKKLND